MGKEMVDKVYGITHLQFSEKYLLVTMACFGDDSTRTAWISPKELVDLTGISRRQMFRLLKSLKTQGLIERAPGVMSKSLWSLHLGDNNGEEHEREL